MLSELINMRAKSYNASHRKKVEIKKIGRIFNSVMRHNSLKMDKLLYDKHLDLLITGQYVLTDDEISNILTIE